MVDVKKKVTKRYLVDNNKLPLLSGEKTVVSGYLGVDPTVRIRVTETGAWIQIWKPSDQTHFYEYEIPIDEGEKISALCLQKTVKNTQIVEYRGREWRVNEYLGRHQGLWTATLEIDSKEGYEEPPWVTKNISSDSRFTDEALSKFQLPPRIEHL